MYGIPFPNITWLKDDQPLPTSDPRVRVVSGGVQLQLLIVDEGDTGTYACQAISPAGQDQATFDLLVLGNTSNLRRLCQLLYITCLTLKKFQCY